MASSGTGSFTFADYEETTFGEVDGGPKVTRTTVTNTYTGTIQGQGKQAYLGLYRNDDPDGWGTGAWVGLEQITGQLGDRKGSFAVQQRGSFDASGVQGAWEVVDGSGTGELTRLRGQGTFRYTQDGTSADYTFDYTLN